MTDLPGFLEDGLEDTLAAFTLHRNELVRLLERLEEDRWRRGGMHARNGPQTIADIAALLAGHDAEHLAQIAAALQQGMYTATRR